jgi:hypothetical protein
MTDPFQMLREELVRVAAQGAAARSPRSRSWLRRRPRLLAVLAATLVIGGSAAAAVSLSSNSSQPLSGKVPGLIEPASLAGYRYTITVTPNLDAGAAFWNTSITYSNKRGAGSGGGGGSLYPSASNPLFGADTDSFSFQLPPAGPRGDTVGYVLTGPQVAAVRLGTRTIRTVASPELPAGDRAAVFFLPAGAPVLTTGWRPGQPIRSVIHINPAVFGLPGGYRGPRTIPTLAVLPLDAQGNVIPTHPTYPSGPFPYFWQAPSAVTPNIHEPPYHGPSRPLPGVCELAQHGLPGLTAEWGHAIHRIAPVRDSTGELFLSCVDTEYYLRGWPIAAGVLLDARQPGRTLGAIPGARLVAGHPDTVDFEGGNLTARRSSNAWLVVQGGSGMRQRLEVLAALKISRLDLHR